MLKHIALQVDENDIQDFYIQILCGNITHQFNLNAKLAGQLFNISQEINVQYLILDQIQFELFVYSTEMANSFNHICLELENAKEIFEQAIVKNYWTFLRKTNNTETYFIKDTNNNMFEIKNKL